MGNCPSSSALTTFDCTPCDSKSDPGSCLQGGLEAKLGLWDCSQIKLSHAKDKPTTKQECECCNKQLIWDALMRAALIAFPFGTTYGNWLTGVDDPFLSYTLKAFVGSFAVLLVFFMTVRKDSSPFKRATFQAAINASLVLGTQVVTDFFFHNLPTRFFAAFAAGLGCWWRQRDIKPVIPEIVPSFWIFLVSMAAFAGNWSLMGKNVASRFISSLAASSAGFLSSISECMILCLENDFDPKSPPNKDSNPFMASLTVGFVSALASVFADGAFEKPTLSGFLGGAAALYMANEQYKKPTWANCLTNKCSAT